MSSTAEHNALCNECLVALGTRPGVRIERYEPTEGKMLFANGTTAYIRRGTPGHPDLTGWVSADGSPALWFGQEVKTGNARRNPNQVAFHARAEKDNASVRVIRSVAESVAHIDELVALARRIAALLRGAA